MTEGSPADRARRPGEILLVLLALFLAFVGVFGLTQDLGLRRFFFQLTDDTEAVLVGKLAGLAGGSSLRRQRAQDVAFNEIQAATDLYNGDTVVTDNATTAVLEFQDGSRMELAPGSMVQLVFETRYGWDGIQRLWNIQVVLGSVTARSAGVPMRLTSARETVELKNTVPTTLQATQAVTPVAPAPAPEPAPVPTPVPVAAPKPIEAKVQIISPQVGALLSVAPKTTARQVRVDFVARLTGVKEQEFLIRAYEGGTAQKVFEKKVTAEKDTIRANWLAKKPGAYRWEILTAAGAAVKSQGKAVNVAFEVSPWIEGIEILDPLIAGKILSSNRLDGDMVQNFSVTLRWKAKAPAPEYRLWFGEKADSTKALMEKTVKQPEYSFNKDRLFAGSVAYRVTADLPGGWRLTSGNQKFAFNYLPPILVVPPPGSVLEVAPNDPEATVLFTWQKTNFTKGYEFQVSADPSFTHPLLTKAFKDNLFVMPAPSRGRYYWRVRSFSDSVSSTFGKPSDFEIKR